MSQLRLLRERRFGPLFWTQFFGAFNDNFFKNALVILITFRATSVAGVPPAQMVALAGGIFILPFFLFSASAGQLADKFEKSRIIRIIKLAEILIMALAAFGFLTERMEFLLVVLFLMGLHSTYFGPIKYSILPQHLRDKELVGGNALVEAGTFLSILIGTITGGILIGLEGVGPAVVSAGLMICALIGYVASRSIPPAPPVSPDLRVHWNLFAPTVDILRITRENRVVFLSILGISWFWFFGASMLSLFPTYGKDVLHGDQSLVTLFLACFSVGIGIGSMLCERLSRHRLELGLVPFGSLGITIFAADLFFAGAPDLVAAVGLSSGPVSAWAMFTTWSGARILIDLLGIAIFSGFFIVPLYTLIQERSNPAFRSRTVAGNNILNALFMVVASILLVALQSAGFTIPQIFLVLSVLNAAVAIYIYSVIPEFFFRFSMWMLAHVFYRLRVEGLEKLPYGKPAILVSNHVSFVDWLLIGAAIPQPVRFVMHHSFARTWLWKRLLSRAKVILIAGAKENPALLAQAFEQIDRELAEGEFVCIFPEGQITYDGELSPFRPGVERALAKRPVVVVPMALSGMWGSFFSRKGGGAIKKMPRRFWSRVILRIGDPVQPEQAQAAYLQTKVAELLAREK